MHCCSVFGLSTIRSSLGVLACAAFLLAGTTVDEASAAPASICKPALTVKEVTFSPVNPETMIRTWTATVLVEASRCASPGGSFEILFTRLMENGPDADFTEQFEWKPDVVEVAVDFWADEAVEAYRITRINECACRR
jgi:hypothetical protein